MNDKNDILNLIDTHRVLIDELIQNANVLAF